MARGALLIMRHATAGSGGGSDHARPLTPAGRSEAQRVGERLRADGPIPDLVLCSSALRCRETWQSLVDGLGSEPTARFDDVLYGADAGGLLDVLASVDQARSVLLLAHNPGVSVLALELGGGREPDADRLRRGFAPASLACFEVESDWSLVSARTARLVRFEHAPRG